jgi:hypothetical protein
MNFNIVDIYELASILKPSHHTLKKNWRKFPHFFIGDGCNLKGARFDVSEVVEHFKKEARHVSLEGSQKKSVDSKIQIQHKAVQERRVQDEIKSIGVGSRKTKRVRKSAGAGTDPFNLLSGVDKVS